jgi:hypothetical protein
MTSNLKRTMGWALAASLLLAGRAAAQDRRVSIPVSVREAQGVLVAAYPELREGRLAWRIESTPTGVVVEAREAVMPTDATASRTAPLVAAAVTVDEQGRLQALQAGGTLIERARQQSAGVATRSRDVDADLKALGAKFPPGDPAARDSLVPLGLQHQLGAPTRRETSFRAEGTADAPQDALTWRVELESGEAVPRQYTLVFEPVEGRLLSLVRR